MNESLQQELLLNDPVQLFGSKKYQQVLHKTVKKFAAKKRLSHQAQQNIVTEIEAILYSEVAENIKQNFDANYHLLLPFFERVVFNYCINITSKILID